LFLFFKNESAFFFEKKKQKTFDYKDNRLNILSGMARMIVMIPNQNHGT